MRTYIKASPRGVAVRGMIVDILALYTAITIKVVKGLKQAKASPEVARALLIEAIDIGIKENGGGKSNDESTMDTRSEAG